MRLLRPFGLLGEELHESTFSLLRGIRSTLRSTPYLVAVGIMVFITAIITSTAAL